MEKILRNRAVGLLVVFLFLLGLAGARLFELQVFHFGFYKEKVEEQRLRIMTLAAPRGDIYDRNGERLATSVDAFSFFVVPREVVTAEAPVQFLSSVLQIDKGEVSKKLSSQLSFVWLKRKVDEKIAQQVLAKEFKGIYAIKEKKRVYPKGSLAAAVLGFVGIDNQGLAGVELSQDQYLRGEEGKILTERDPRGREIVAASRKILAKPSYGMDIKLTLDANLQYYTEKQLAAVLKQFSARSGSIVVLNAKNGEILALASLPGFNPEHYTDFPSANWKCGPAANVYEPGSTFKVITAASGLQAGVIDKDSRLKFLDKILVGGKVIENSHPITRFGSSISVSEMLQESVNTAAAQIGMLLGEKAFYDLIVRFGFGEYTRAGLPGESRGILRHYKDWYKSDVGMITFGQGIAVTPLQMVAAVGAIANGGQRLQPQLVAKIESLDGKFVKVAAPQVLAAPISKDVARQVVNLMEEVVLYGTGRRGKIEGFKVAGKTGTAQKTASGRLGYLEGKYIASYVGFAPASDPALVVLVIVDEPQGCYWGESVAGPTFKLVMEHALQYLNIPPDNV